MNITQAINGGLNIGRVAYERYRELYNADAGIEFYPPWDSLANSAKHRWIMVASTTVDAFMKESLKTTNGVGRST